MDEFAGFIVLLAILVIGGLFGHWTGRISESSDIIYSCTHFQKYEPHKDKWVECRMVKQ